MVCTVITFLCQCTSYLIVGCCIWVRNDIVMWNQKSKEISPCSLGYMLSYVSYLKIQTYKVYVLLDFVWLTKQCVVKSVCVHLSDCLSFSHSLVYAIIPLYFQMSENVIFFVAIWTWNGLIGPNYGLFCVQMLDQVMLTVISPCLVSLTCQCSQSSFLTSYFSKVINWW